LDELSGPENPFLGVWRITDMEFWGSEELDLLGPPFIAFEPEGLGGFQFLAVQGELDHRVEGGAEGPLARFTWAGLDDGEPCGGRGLVRLEGWTLKGRIFFHLGDESSFEAER
jgi:hypothetical protein